MPMKTSPSASPAQDLPAPPNKYVRLRNGCVVAAAACYVLINLIGYVTLHHLTMFTSDHGMQIIGSIRLLGVAITGLYVAFCCYGAKARGWSGGVGALIALLGAAIWFGLAIALLFQNVNHGFSTANEPRVYDDRLPWLVGVAFVVSALALLALPKRPEARAKPAPQGV